MSDATPVRRKGFEDDVEPAAEARRCGWSDFKRRAETAAPRHAENAPPIGRRRDAGLPAPMGALAPIESVTRKLISVIRPQRSATEAASNRRSPAGVGKRKA